MSDEKKIAAEAPAPEETAAAELTEEQLEQVAGGGAYPDQGRGGGNISLEEKVLRGWK
ncbi:hypothetical protein [Microbacterium sp. TPD7012]|uniref:hypothetical protein n=1 Tax=unclassified Microbacterium TaxID=2609290 RepID=UPI001402C7F1|nr:hypothetical protein [Microbacterium sp. TPD7012]